MKGNNATNQQEMAIARKLQHLLAIGLAMPHSSSEDLLEMISEAAADLTGSDSALLMLLDPNSGHFYPIPTGNSDEADDRTIPAEGSVGGKQGGVARASAGQRVVLHILLPDLLRAALAAGFCAKASRSSSIVAPNN